MSLYGCARANLTRIITFAAYERAAAHGFGWEAVPDAPSSYDDLMRRYTLSKRTHAPLPISNLFCDTSVYVGEHGNHAFRFWHDITHVEEGLTFEPEDEIEVALAHLRELEAWGYGSTSLEYRLLKADGLGQTLCYVQIGRFPVDQLRFARWCVTDGIEEAIAYEASIE